MQSSQEMIKAQATILLFSFFPHMSYEVALEEIIKHNPKVLHYLHEQIAAFQTSVSQLSQEVLFAYKDTLNITDKH